jgi:hypothetical protein
MIQQELRQQIRDHLAANGGIPEGDCTLRAKISLDSAGNVVDYKFKTSCDIPRINEAIRAVLQVARISEPPPADMPKTLKLRISKKG